MSETPSNPPSHDISDRLLGNARVNETTQTILTALILAFVFRAYLVEAFIIPTGSMAESLCGMHGAHVCERCGWEFDFGPELNSYADPDVFQVPLELVCPNCGLTTRVDQDAPPPSKAGDRVLVMKWPFLLGGALDLNRWDVIVFRNPIDPEQNFIKRLIGLPGESVEILCGDVFINGQVARKTPVAQGQLWSIVADQDYAPAQGFRPAAEPAWVPERDDSAWTGAETRVIHFASQSPTPERLLFNPLRPIRDTLGYNHADSTSYVGDLRVQFELRWSEGVGTIEWELERFDYAFRATLAGDGQVALYISETPTRGAWREVGRCELGPLPTDRPLRVEFAHVDRRAYVRVDEREILTTNENIYPTDIESLRSQITLRPSTLSLSAADCAFELRGLRVDKDVHYAYRRGRTLRAVPGTPFELTADEYFVLGDNSANSHDSREWDMSSSLVRDYYRMLSEKTPAVSPYRTGTVRRALIVGRAVFVYLPGLTPMDDEGRFRMPDIGRMRFVR